MICVCVHTYFVKHITSAKFDSCFPLIIDGGFEGQDSDMNAAQSNMPPPEAPNNFVPGQPAAPYPPVGGLFNMPNYQPEGLNLPMPGTHAPPSTPNGINQLSPSSSTSNVNPTQEKTGE